MLATRFFWSNSSSSYFSISTMFVMLMGTVSQNWLDIRPCEEDHLDKGSAFMQLAIRKFKSLDVPMLED